MSENLVKCNCWNEYTEEDHLCWLGITADQLKIARINMGEAMTDAKTNDYTITLTNEEAMVLRKGLGYGEELHGYHHEGWAWHGQSFEKGAGYIREALSILVMKMSNAQWKKP